jgi:hypothetical protein
VNSVEVEIKKQLKIAARKRHYYAIFQMLDYLMGQAGGMKTLLDSMDKVDDESQMPEEAKKAAITASIMTILPIYQITVSLREYKQAFGEYPEWLKFTPWGSKTPDEVTKTLESIESIEKKFLVINQQTKTTAKMDLLKLAFGDSYIKAAESVKLKGET